ncbi:HAMP domain-containing sensor histidine kinase [Velocimicrobium porci]|uniref:histidine kinase n=1 Tax=Velocimicrobium porci TaxID=2606634 RepID=A0A6L5XZ92_9FIRM|nr:HAMP domain-containing sensor histidine kinase [Velocimicrobium porci]MSS63791.1 HAMP domain-containing protein [Velocimicrobium porci]
MKHSIRFRLVLTLIVSLTCTIFLCWILNKSLLAPYYEKFKVESLGKVYTEIDSIYKESSEDNSTSTEEISLAMESLGANKNMTMYVFQIEDDELGLNINFLYPALDVFQRSQVVKQILEYATLETDIRGHNLLTETGEYRIYKIFDKRINSHYLELFGALDEKTGVYIRSNYQSMLESVSISNQFLAYAGIAAVILGSAILFVVSRSFTKPILELSNIATQMSNLNFDIKYCADREDEIGTLGKSMNVLSEKLEYTISELKSANNELQKDIEHKIQIDEMRTEFLSNVSHELKTPIALIQGYAEGLKENINDDEESRNFYCDVIIDEANKMNKMVKKLLSLNQIESGKDPVTFERFDIVSLIQSVLNATEIMFQQQKITVTFAEREPIYVWADEYMIEEVITNYISNAVNHIDGERRIEVKLTKTNELVRVTVTNTGKPIPEEDIDKVWIKFFKVDKARTREYGGSGIGLSIVKAIMDSHNREYGVRNTDDGVAFWFELDRKNE